MGPLRSVVLCRRRHRWAHLPAARLRRLPAPARPGRPDHLPGHPEGPGERADPAGRLRPAAHPGLPAAPLGQHEPGAHPGPDVAARPARPARCIDEVEADVVVGFGGYVSVPGYLAAWRRELPIVIHEVNVPAGRGQPARHEVHQARRGRLPAPAGAVRVAARRPGGRRAAAPRRSRRSTGRRMRAAARAHFGLRPDLPVLFVSGGSQGARSINLAVAGAAKELARAGVQVLHVIGARNEPVAIPTDLPVPYVTAAVPVRDGAGLRRGRPDARPGRRDDLRRGGRGRPARRLRAATRTATRSSGATRCPWSRPAAACSSTTPS